MNFDKLDLSHPAHVHWRNPSPHQPAVADRQRRFASVVNAVRFVMEDLTDMPQSTAWIKTDMGEITFEQIKILYSRLR